MERHDFGCRRAPARSLSLPLNDDQTDPLTKEKDERFSIAGPDRSQTAGPPSYNSNNNKFADFVHHDSPVGPAISVYPKGVPGGDRRQNPYGFHPMSPEEENHRSPVPPQDRGVTSEEAYPVSPTFEDRKSFVGNPMLNSHHHDRAPHQEHYYHHHPPSRTHYQHRPDRQWASRSMSSVPNHHHNHYMVNQPPPPPPPPVPSMVEISPGVHVRLRGAVETKECILQNFFVSSSCFSCTLEMYCIRDASYVLCPSCRVVNPLASNTDKGGKEEEYDGGLGLGFTLDDLNKTRWENQQQQAEWAAQRRSFSYGFGSYD